MNPTRLVPVIIATALLAFCLPQAAAESIWGEFDALDTESVPLNEEEEDVFAGRVQFGYIAASGNAETTNVNSQLVLGWDLEKWRHAVAANAIYSEDDETVIAENYRAAYKADRKLDEQNYLFGTLSWEQDEFAGYTERTTEAVGYGRRMFETDTQRLDLEIGVGARQTEQVDGTQQDETIGRLAGDYRWQFGEHSEFSQRAVVESGDENTYVESVTSLTAQLLGELDLVVGYTIKRNSSVPEGVEKTDTYTTVNVQYSF